MGFNQFRPGHHVVRIGVFIAINTESSCTLSIFCTLLHPHEPFFLQRGIHITLILQIT